MSYRVLWLFTAGIICAVLSECAAQGIDRTNYKNLMFQSVIIPIHVTK